jgi:cobalt/nickel transport system permease protein
VGAGHAHQLHVAGDSPVHRLPPHCKIVALVAFVLLVVATPVDQYWAFGVHAVLVAAVVAAAGLRPGLVLRRMSVEIPFVLFAVLLPFVARGPQVELLGLSVSRSGLLAAWGILAKGTLGVAGSVVLAATTRQRELLVGLQRLRVPELLVQIMTFMFRYAEVVGAEMHRMRIARESRAFVARDVRALPVVARSAGALFIRSYERGERVHLAMLSRGYTGTLPVTSSPAAAAQWGRSALLPTAALLVAVTAWALA